MNSRFQSRRRLAALAGLWLASGAVGAAEKFRTLDEILTAAPASDWRPLDVNNTLYMELSTGRVVIELAPAYAPQHVANIKTLVREGYFDGLAILRAQDNYVVQWGDPDGKREIKFAQRNLPAEFTREWNKTFPFTKLDSVDGYAPEVGFAYEFPAGRDRKKKRTWLAHCYGMVGAGRGNEADSGDGTQLYAVIGHAPRQLDRNITLVGRVIEGMELLSVLPRSGGKLGFYQTEEQRTLIKSVRIAADVPAEQRSKLKILRTDTASFAEIVDIRRTRHEEWFKYPVGYVGLCNVPIIVEDIK